MSRVSVIIPTYNRARYLSDAIRSVVNQTFQDFEIIVIDDCSQDQTRIATDSFKDQRIKYLTHDSNRGEAAARNTGIQKSTGSYIAFLDDDDQWAPEKLQLQIQIFEQSATKVGLVYCGYE